MLSLTIEVSLQITITLSECAWLIILQFGFVKLLAWTRLGIEPTTLDLSSQSGAYNLSATATSIISIRVDCCADFWQN